jgi:RHS repeat-associated protein
LGVPTSSGNSSSYPYLFAGMEYDPTGLYHTYARYYSPRLQRFTSEDPLQYGGGDINLFRYAADDPVNAADPLGLQVDVPSIPDVGGGGPRAGPTVATGRPAESRADSARIPWQLVSPLPVWLARLVSRLQALGKEANPHMLRASA